MTAIDILEEDLGRLRERLVVSAEDDLAQDVRVEICFRVTGQREAELKRQGHSRILAHVDHLPGPVICVAAELAVMDEEIRLGVLAHELGHLLADTHQDITIPGDELAKALAIYGPGRALDEAHANTLSHVILRAPITYGGDQLQRTILE